jgi:hypothetical protein
VIERMMNCNDCVYVDIADWEQNAITGKAKAILWCEKYRHFCSDITDCEYYKKDSEE